MEDPILQEGLLGLYEFYLKNQSFGIEMLLGFKKLHLSLKNILKTIHNSTELKPIDDSRKSNENKIYSILQDRRVRQKLYFVRSADIKEFLVKAVEQIGHLNHTQ